MKKKIIALFKKNSGRGFKSRDIAKMLTIIDQHEYDSLKSFLHSMVEEGSLIRSGKRYMLNNIPRSNKITGELQITQGGFGFVIPKDPGYKDVFIAARNLSTAFNGDTVEVILFANQRGKNLEGQITGILKRKRDEIVGTLQKTNSFYFLKPDDRDLHRDIYISKNNLKGAKTGDKVIAGNIKWESPDLNPEGEIIEFLGKSGSHDTEIISLAHEFNLSYRFSDKTLLETEQINEEYTPEDLKERIDCRNKTVFTIDPVDAKDFDDALSIELLENDNYSVGIHIADVSNYVNYHTNLDKEAFIRGNSVYLVGKVIPMLPEKLSNNICSLVPYKDRLTYSVIVEISKRGKLVKYEIEKSIINSKRRFTYEEVQEIIDNGKGDFAKEIVQMNSLAQTLRKKRLREGSIDFFSPEVKFELDENGAPIRIYKKETQPSNMLVEEYMLLANKLVAKHIAAPEKGAVKPFVYRVHDLPDNEKIYEFSKFVKSLGYSFDPNAASKSNQFHLLMQSVKGTEEEAVINELAIRTMAKAIYSIHNIGHYGLGFKYYTHFTSPIRRYSDLMVHRLLFQYMKKKGNFKYSSEELDEISDHLSITERNAVEAERKSVKLNQIEYLQNHIGEQFHAIISGVTHFGIFVKITDILAEGLVKLRDLENDAYVYDERKYALVGKAGRKQYRLGDKVIVKLIRVDVERSELDFLILE
ncbi:MAG: ribonuclease R [Ignavibacteriaceae bacterium]|nr:ribonuclease R [Ignavibacteriaceae bacterium]